MLMITQKNMYWLTDNYIESMVDDCMLCLDNDDIFWALDAFGDLDPVEFL